MQPVRTVAIAVFGLFLLLFPSQTLAQQSPAQQPSEQPPPAAQQPNVTDAELRSFAKVYVQLEKIRATYEPQVKGATSPEEGKKIEIEEVLKMHQAITQEGVSEDNYKRIIDISRADEEFRKKLIGFINEERQKS
jgi:hypothetical protein